MASSRRAFLGLMAAVLPAKLGATRQGLDAFTGGPPPCEGDARATPAVPPDATYRPGAPRRTSLLEPGVTGQRLSLTGLVAGLSCGPIAGAELEFWQADGRGGYDLSGFRLRGRQHTDADGRYRLMTVRPGPPPGRAPHLALHVVVAGRAELWTALFLPGHPLNARDRRHRPALEIRLTGETGTFDVRLDL
jgi:protocatechuate 3,4-dioxygenase beta subunit